MRNTLRSAIGREAAACSRMKPKPLHDRPLGKLHLWWLSEFAKCEGGRMATGGHRGAYGAAFKTLCDRGMLRLDASFDSFGLFEITDAGRAALAELSK